MSPGTATSRAIDPQAAAPAWRPEQLPPFPAIALKALNLMAGRDTSLLELCDLIRQDPAFSTAILKIANSPLVAFSRDVTSVVQASMLLGFQRLKSIVITVGLKAYLEGPVAPLLQSCWQHSVACAMIAERAAGEGGLDRDFAYTAGIMHDIGRVAMVAAEPKLYAQVIEKETADPRDLLPREKELFGVDHSEAGASLVKLWKLPEAFREITSMHHNFPGQVAGMTSVVVHSCTMADTLGFGMMRYQAIRGYEEILSALPEAARKRFPKEADAFAGEITNQIRVIETA